MNLVVVGIGDCQVSIDPQATLVTYALGSCIAVLAHDPVSKIGGMLHYMLPESSLNQERALRHPAVFGDTGIPMLIEGVLRKGADRNRLTLRVAGGAQLMDEKGVFNIGKRNQLVVKKLLWKAGLMVHAEETGGMLARTVRMEVATGRAFLRAGGAEREWPLQQRPAISRGGTQQW
jgi:chemotaxis protein CheD